MNKYLYTLMVFISFSLAAQEERNIYVDGHFKQQKTFADSLEERSWINQKLFSLWSAGYLYSGLDSITGKNVYLHRGKKISGTIGGMLVYRENPSRYDTLKELQGERLSLFLQEMLNGYINRGYPFARVHIDSLVLQDEKYEAFFSVRPGPKVVYDSVALVSKVKINKGFLTRTLNMQQGALFSEKAFRAIPKRIGRVSFLELTRMPDVGFSDGKATVYLDLRQRATNSFEGVVGLLPNQSTSEGLAFTGYLDLVLSNLFRSGKALNVTWHRFADQSQSLNLFYHHPYFLSSKIFLDAGFSLIKQDTTFLTQTWEVGAGSYLTDDVEVLFSFKKKNGSLNSPAPVHLQAGFADYTNNLYSISLRHPLYNQPFGLTSGFTFQSRFSLGEKQIKTNSAISAEWYDSLDAQTILADFEAAIRFQSVLNRKLAIYHDLLAGSIINKEILNNELVRLGGLKTLRGFNENFFFAQHYILSRFELRQYFERQSYFMLFYDQLFYTQHHVWGFPRGFGAGLALQTSGGLFNFALALGASEDIQLDVSNIKIHLGYISRF